MNFSSTDLAPSRHHAELPCQSLPNSRPPVGHFPISANQALRPNFVVRRLQFSDTKIHAMGGHLLKGFQFLHAVLFILSAAAFIIFWVRTRFWLPKYAHLLAAIGLLVGVWSISIASKDAPINKHGPAARFLYVLVLPAMVYVFFVSYGGQRAAFRHKPKTANEIADLIDRFLSGTSLYPQEWNDFVERSHPDKMLDSYRKRCNLLDPLVNCPDPQDPKALEEMRGMVLELRTLSTPD
jgi:hypothetical protein